MRVPQQLFALLGTVAMLLLCEGASQPAEACTFPTLFPIVTSPALGESNVPVNVVIDIVVFADPMPADVQMRFGLYQTPEAFLIATTTTRVDSNVPFLTTIRLTPTAWLSPNLTYEIRQGSTPLATFSTGNLPDIMTPSPPTGATATADTFDSHPDGGDCITERIRLVRLSVPPASKPVVYTITEGTQVITSFDSKLTGNFYCSGQARWQGDPSWVISPGQHTIQLSATDRAGNFSAPVELTFNASCAGGPDGGSPDGGPPGGGGGSTAPTSGGCSASTGIQATIVLAAFATMLFVRGRKRSEPLSG
jgi:hypothetical protein